MWASQCCQFAPAATRAGCVLPPPQGEEPQDAPEWMRLTPPSNLETMRLIQLCLANHKQTECVHKPIAVYIDLVTRFSKDRSPSAGGYGLDSGVPGRKVTMCSAGRTL